MIGLDTDVPLRWLVDEAVWPDDAPDQTAKAAEALSRRDAQFFVNAVVLAETIWILARPLRQKKLALAALIRRLLDTSNIAIGRRDAAEAALAAWTKGRRGFADHLIGAINRSAGCSTTLTFDQKAEPADAYTRLRRES
ncbi:PIN domain-containing protein [Methylobacterium sp. J-070]|uniref:PIN domain-containing protein n=1 Tax=Methylobacterium sp. J-070 TaxID=2836650 RepID=UPI001FB92591|nr:PIN domain-containing protein [Methylobacterium sp. J-070]MCJ2052994.1 PIN domain-containing protein [Methylobacterium sp. J-070]